MPERVVSYQVLNQQTASGFWLTAPSLERLYIDGALALTDFLVSLDRIQVGETRQIQVEGANRDQLMANWLCELLSLFENEKYLCRRVVFKKFDGKRIEATLFGERFESIRHGGSPYLKSLFPQEIQVSAQMDPEPLFSLKMLLGEQPKILAKAV